ncbi:hypothetical protein [Calothrix sp. NIES-2098]|uniref:hypothetical protein n=1 Tax=Calothrix sp. NIES-2098 TaxID=1954171 RepID=UPI000B5E6BC7|nr:hypothetical protein NIES2098_50780 [Calothrix sp. NIES-2098]
MMKFIEPPSRGSALGGFADLKQLPCQERQEKKEVYESRAAISEFYRRLSAFIGG